MGQPVDALTRMRAAVVSSGRQTAVQLPITFARSADSKPMLARLMAGGQGGSVRLRLYLTLAMQATSVPRSVPARTPAAYARLLGLDDETGPRRVSAALSFLVRLRLIERTGTRPGRITLLKPDGSGDEWIGSGSPRWIGLPLQLWQDGWVFALSARALAVYIALTELNGGTKNPNGEYMDTLRKRTYGMSDDTWTRATVDLREAGLLETTTERTGDDYSYFRFRKRYRLIHPKDVTLDWSTFNPE